MDVPDFKDKPRASKLVIILWTSPFSSRPLSPESGFAYAGALLQLLGVNTEVLGFKEEAGFRNIDKIGAFDKPTLIIHAERDHIIPFSDGQALYDACGSSEKRLLMIPGANHNNIFMRGLSQYMAAVKALSEKTEKCDIQN